jgi:hypothetical protein
MLKQVLVPREHGTDMMLIKQGHIESPEIFGWLFHMRTPVRTGREGRLMTKNNDVDVAASVESFELPFHPLKLLLVPRDIRIQSDHERVAIPEGVGRMAAQTTGRPLWRDEGRHRIEIVS